jgi:hypothetical protein
MSVPSTAGHAFSNSPSCWSPRLYRALTRSAFQATSGGLKGIEGVEEPSADGYSRWTFWAASMSNCFSKAYFWRLLLLFLLIEVKKVCLSSFFLFSFCVLSSPVLSLVVAHSIFCYHLIKLLRR